MNKPKFNIDAHAYWLLCEGQQVEVDGQKIQLTIVEEAKKTINLHADSWGVYNDGSQRFKDTVIKWINEHKNPKAQGANIANYYGVISGGSQVCFEGTENFTHILTIDEFCALAYPEKEEGSELVGKWVRCVNGRKGLHPDTNEWVEIEKVGSNDPSFTEHIGIKRQTGQLCFYPKLRFDLAYPLDYNPETLIGKYYQGNQIESIYFDDDEVMIPRFKLNNGLAVLCSIVTPSDVTDTPPVKSLKYEDCFERVRPNWYANLDLEVRKCTLVFGNNVATERQAKQLAATIKLMTIMHDANGGEWVPNEEDIIYEFYYNRKSKEIKLTISICTIGNMIYFRDEEAAKRAYEENKEVFHDYFGINE